MSEPGAATEAGMSTTDLPIVAAVSIAEDSNQVAEASSSKPHLPSKKRKAEPEELEPLDVIFARRTTVIKEGDNVLLRLPSDAIKAVVASKDGLVQLGKFGAFPSSELLGMHYDITYEIIKSEGTAEEKADEAEAEGSEALTRAFGQASGKKAKKKKGTAGNGEKSNPGWKSTLRPLKRAPILDAVIDDIQETNQFIEDTTQAGLMSQDEISELRAQGISAEEMMKKQIERHEKFGLKTDFSKEKWRKRKEKKFSQTVHALAPSVPNITTHYLTRSPMSIMYLREDTMSQLLTLANIREGGRYLVVDDTGGLVTAAMMDRMGCRGRILSITENEGPPASGVLGVMNWSERELDCVRSLNWLEAEEDYEKPPPPDEDGLPAIASQKTAARLRKHNAQVAELNGLRNELHEGGWDSLVLATELSPISILARLTPYIIGSGNITVYSPHLQVLAETLQWAKKDANYLGEAITESWTREYQVLPGRTHPLMTTSATGGLLFTATRVHPSSFEPESHGRRKMRQQQRQSKQKAKAAEAAKEASEAAPATESDSAAQTADILPTTADASDIAMD